MAEWGTCRGCKRRMLLSDGGTVTAHGTIGWTCPGVGKKPLRKRTPPKPKKAS